MQQTTKTCQCKPCPTPCLGHQQIAFASLSALDSHRVISLPHFEGVLLKSQMPTKPWWPDVAKQFMSFATTMSLQSCSKMFGLWSNHWTRNCGIWWSRQVYMVLNINKIAEMFSHNTIAIVREIDVIDSFCPTRLLMLQFLFSKLSMQFSAQGRLFLFAFCSGGSLFPPTCCCYFGACCRFCYWVHLSIDVFRSKRHKCCSFHWLTVETECLPLFLLCTNAPSVGHCLSIVRHP